MKTMTIFGGLSVLALAAAAGLATAQTAPVQDHQGWGHHGGRGGHARDADNDGRVSQAEFMGDHIARLTALDANRDGAVSVEERMAARFDRLDADKNGSVTRAEFDAARADRPDRAGRGTRGDRVHGERGRGRGHDPMHAGRMGGRDGDGPRAERGGGPAVIAEVQSKMTERFAAIDANHDGFLSADERTAARAAMRTERQERRATRMANPASPPAPGSE